MANLHFLMRVLASHIRGQDKTCPYCRSDDTSVIGRKKLVLQLRRCQHCSLMFRWPKDSTRVNESFYQTEYRQELTTEAPPLSLLDKMKENGFRDSQKDYTHLIAVLKALVPSGRVLDFGCSWGYATFQMRRVGYDAVGFEVSKSRAEFGRKHLSVEIFDQYGELDQLPAGSFDAIFTYHVIEHLPLLDGVFERFHTLLRTGGAMLIFVPNCGGTSAVTLGPKWGPMLCEKHPLALDRTFFNKALPRHGLSVATFSEPYDPDDIRSSVLNNSSPGHALGEELMVYAVKMDNNVKVSLKTGRNIKEPLSA